jgi:hypothetical protein
LQLSITIFATFGNCFATFGNCFATFGNPPFSRFFRFDTSDNGRRLAPVLEDGKLKIKTVSDSPEIRNLSDNDHDHDHGDESDEGSADGTNVDSVDTSAAPGNR